MSKDGRKNNQPPKETQFKRGQSGNPAGRPRKRANTFEEEIKAVFGEERSVQINGTPKMVSMRQVIIEQIARGAAKGDPKMIKISIPFLKIMDAAPEFEILPEDNKILKNFLKKFNDDGGENDDS